jgi:hypothetical protein
MLLMLVIYATQPNRKWGGAFEVSWVRPHPATVAAQAAGATGSMPVASASEDFAGRGLRTSTSRRPLHCFFAVKPDEEDAKTMTPTKEDKRRL